MAIAAPSAVALAQRDTTSARVERNGRQGVAGARLRFAAEAWNNPAGIVVVGKAQLSSRRPKKTGRREDLVALSSRRVPTEVWFLTHLAPHAKEVGMRPVTKSIATAAAVVLGGLSLSACATTDYVDEQIAAVNNRVSAVDAKAQDAIQRADAAAAAAQAANSAAEAAAAEARTANQRLDQLTPRVDGLEQRAAPRGRQPRN